MVREEKVKQAKDFIRNGVYDRPHNEDAIMTIVTDRIALVLGLTEGEKG